MPLFPEFEIGVTWGAKDKALLDSSWKALTWELYVDDHAIDLHAFGTFDFEWLIPGGAGAIPQLESQTGQRHRGKHTLRYVNHVNQQVDDGFSVTQPGTYEAVVNLTLVPQAATPTATHSHSDTGPNAPACPRVVVEPHRVL